MLPKQDGLALKIPEIVKVARFSHNPTSLYQSLLVGFLEITVRYSNQPILIKELTRNWEKYFALAKDFAKEKSYDPRHIYAIEAFLANLLKASSTLQALSLLGNSFTGLNPQLNMNAELTMKLIICSMMPGKNNLHNLILNEQPLDSNYYAAVFNAIVVSFGIRILVYEWIGMGCEEAKYSRQNAGNFVNLYLYKYSDMLALLYHQKMLDQETNPNFDENQLLQPLFLRLGHPEALAVMVPKFPPLAPMTGGVSSLAREEQPSRTMVPAVSLPPNADFTGSVPTCRPASPWTQCFGLARRPSTKFSPSPANSGIARPPSLPNPPAMASPPPHSNFMPPRPANMPAVPPAISTDIAKPSFPPLAGSAWNLYTS
jgi:hypothetical protein